MKKVKIGRNSQCPCGSGKKYKKCHLITTNELQDIIKVQKKIEQGYGIPIESTVNQEKRMVRVGDLVYSGNWKTFHDFLLSYLGEQFNYDRNTKVMKELDSLTHPLNVIFNKTLALIESQPSKNEGIHRNNMTGAVSISLSLAYNIYLISHNVAVHRELIRRLTKSTQFIGALYETYVSAIFIKAGFKLEFEDENDRSTSHCEFIATYPETGDRFSVEAKCKNWKSELNIDGEENPKIDFIKPLSAALKKIALFPRIIFIELSLPGSKLQANDSYGKELASKMQKHEGRMIANKESPESYVFLTNNPNVHSLDKVESGPFYMPYGFKIPDFWAENWTLDQRIESQKKHFAIYELIESIKSHVTIPATFGGEIPEFAFGDQNNRLLIGNSYKFGDKVGIIKSGTVDTAGKKAWLICQCEEGDFIGTAPLSDNEISAYERHPNTFFGEYQEQQMQSESVFEFYQKLLKVYGKSTKSKLLHFLRDHPEYELLKGKTQKELLEYYCRVMAEQFWFSNQK